MAQFEKGIINYGQFDLPVNPRDYVPLYFRTTTTTFEGVSYQFKDYAVDYTLTSSQLYSSPIDANVVQNNDILWAWKSKGRERYFFYAYHDAGIYACINNRLDFDSSIKINQAIGISRGSIYRNYYMINTINGNNAICCEVLNTNYWTQKALIVCVENESIINFLGEVDSIFFSPTYGNGSETGGYSGGSFDNSSDTITIPNKPLIGVSNIGFVNVYCPSQNALVNLGSELFPNFTPPPTPPTSTDVAEALQMGLNNIVDNISNFTNMFINSKLIDYVIDCHCIPIQPILTGSENIKIGFKSFNQSAPKTTTDYVDFDCGTLNIKEYYTNFIDYVGTRAKLYLPFVGFVPIENEFFQNGLLQVIYRFNIIDGSFMAYVLSSSSKSELSNSVIASYGGNACVHIPITGLNYSNMVSGIASGTVSAIAQVGKGNIGSALNSAMETLSNKPQMQSSNGYNSTSAYLGIRYPYLIIEREVSNFSEYYDNENGLPCNITKKISELSGYIQMDNIHMETLPCMEEEKEMIENLLLSGIIV